MRRRIHLPRLTAGTIQLDPANSHYLRDVLRLSVGEEIEIFDDAGQTASAQLVRMERDGVTVQADEPQKQSQNNFAWSIASAVPKGNRADWMIEKLCELGTARWIPLQTARSVVHPQGQEKLQRWKRIAEEAAKQSRRTGVMQIDPLTPLSALIQSSDNSIIQCSDDSMIQCYCLHPGATSTPILSAFPTFPPGPLFLIGPEGGWSDEELSAFTAANIPLISISSTTLRLETAALTVAAIAQSHGLTINS